MIPLENTLATLSKGVFENLGTLRRLVAEHDSKYFFVSLEPKHFLKICHKFLVRPTNSAIENESHTKMIILQNCELEEHSIYTIYIVNQFWSLEEKTANLGSILFEASLQ